MATTHETRSSVETLIPESSQTQMPAITQDRHGPADILVLGTADRTYITTGQVTPAVEGRFPLAGAARTINRPTTRQASGKTVIIIHDTGTNVAP